MKIKIRRHDNDAPLIEYLDSRLFTEEERVDYIKESAWWVGWKGDIPVAYGGARVVHGTKFAFLSRAGVLQEARGQGIQRRMINIRLRWAATQGCTQAITYTHPENVVSTNNLIKCGFLLFLPEWAWAGKDDKGQEFLYWIKDL